LLTDDSVPSLQVDNTAASPEQVAAGIVPFARRVSDVP
jgi:hypothetical protein